jgi:hypothetical protein
VHTAMAAICLVKGEHTFAADRRDNWVIGTDRPKDLCKVIGTCRETLPAKKDESAHCSKPQFLAESEHVEPPFSFGLRRILSLRAILDHSSEIRCGHCHNTSLFFVRA